MPLIGPLAWLLSALLVLGALLDTRAELAYEVSASTQPPAASETVKAKKKKKTWVWWVLGIAAVAVAAIAVAGAGSGGGGSGGGGGFGGY